MHHCYTFFRATDLLLNVAEYDEESWGRLCQCGIEALKLIDSCDGSLDEEMFSLFPSLRTFKASILVLVIDF